MTTDRVFLDTDVLAYQIDDSQPAKQRNTRELLVGLATARAAAKHQISMWDALILMTAGCAELPTEAPADGSSLRGVKIVNSFLVE